MRFFFIICFFWSVQSEISYYFDCENKNSSHVGNQIDPFGNLNLSLAKNVDEIYNFYILEGKSCSVSTENIYYFISKINLTSWGKNKSELLLSSGFNLQLYENSSISFMNFTIRLKFYPELLSYFYVNSVYTNISFIACEFVSDINYQTFLMAIAADKIYFSEIELTFSNNDGNIISNFITVNFAIEFTMKKMLIINKTIDSLIIIAQYIELINIVDSTFKNIRFEKNAYFSNYFLLDIGNTFFSPSNIFLQNLVFHGNQRIDNNNMGIILISSSLSTVTMQNISFIENKDIFLFLNFLSLKLLVMEKVFISSNYGTCVFFNFTQIQTVSCSNSLFLANIDSENTKFYGTLFYLDKILSCVFENLTFFGNKAYGQLVGIFFRALPQTTDYNNLLINNVSFINNEASFQEYSSIEHMSDCEGVFLCIYDTVIVKLKNSFLLENKVLQAGKTLISSVPAITLSSQSLIVLINLTCKSNSADYSVNGIYLPLDQLEIWNSSFIDHKGGDYGVFYLSGFSFIFMNSLVKNCEGQLGALFYLFLNQKETTYLFENSILKGNFANKANIYLSAVYPFNITFKNCYFFNNSASKQGGVFFIKYPESGSSELFVISLVNNIFENNNADVSGGVGEMWQLSGVVNIYENIFLNNTSNEGAVFNLNQESITYNNVTNCLFIGNYAFSQAAIFNILCASFSDSGSKYYYNKADIAVIYFVSSYCEVTLENSYIYKSEIFSLGNIVFVAKPIVNIANLFIYDSIASVCAGVAFSGLVTLNIDGMTFENNVANRGTLFYSSSLLTVANIKNIISFNNTANISLNSFSFTEVFIENASFLQSSSVVFVIQYANINLENLLVENHNCIPNQVGCFINIISQSYLNIYNITCNNIISLESLGIIYCSSSTIEMKNSFFSNISTVSTADILYSEFSFLNLYAITIKNFLNSAIRGNENYEFNFTNGFCENLNPQSLSCLNLSLTKKILILDSVFQNIPFSTIGISSSLDFLESQTETTIPLIINCMFKNNTNRKNNYSSYEIYAGCIYIENSHINITNSTFQNNQAEIGGAVFLSSKETINSYFLIWNLQNNTFINNSAIISGGGAIFWDYNLPMFKNNYFSKNQANFGLNIASCPFRLNITINTSMTNASQDLFRSFSSGSVLKEGFLDVALLDYYGEIVTSTYGINQDNSIILSFKDIYNISYLKYKGSTNFDMKVILGSTIVEFDSGFFNFTDLKIVALPNNTYTMGFQTNLIQNLNKSLLIPKQENEILLNKTYFYVFNMTMSECLPGEIFNAETNICDVCPYGDYSLDPNDSICKPCPDNAVCEGGDRIIVNPGYWRNSIQSNLIYKCKNQKACVGGYESTCQAGFEGVLCNTCIFNSTDRFFKNFDDLCYVCENAYYSYLIIFGFFVFLIGYQTITIRIKMKSRTYFKSCIMKILLNYLQLVNIIDNFQLEIPESIVSIFRIQSSANTPKQALFPLNCVYGVFNSTENLFLLNSVFVCAFSVGYPLFVCCFLFLRSKIKKFSKVVMKNVMSVSVLIVCYTLQPFFLNFFLSSFNCDKIDNKEYLDDFLNQECWNDYHLSILYYLIIPFLLLWLVLLPLWAFISLKKNNYYKTKEPPSSPESPKINSIEKKDKPQEEDQPNSNIKENPNNFNTYSFITDGYIKEKYYWEFVIMTQKVLVIFSLTFIHDSDALLCLFLFLYFMFIIIQIVMKPFATESLNTLQLFGYFTNFLIVFFCLCFKFRVYEWEALFYLFLIILVNLVFIGFWVAIYIYSSKELFLKIRNFLAKKCPIILRIIRQLFQNIIEKRKTTKSPNNRTKNPARIHDFAFFKAANEEISKKK